MNLLWGSRGCCPGLRWAPAADGPARTGCCPEKSSWRRLKIHCFSVCSGNCWDNQQRIFSLTLRFVYYIVIYIESLRLSTATGLYTKTSQRCQNKVYASTSESFPWFLGSHRSPTCRRAPPLWGPDRDCPPLWTKYSVGQSWKTEESSRYITHNVGPPSIWRPY